MKGCEEMSEKAGLYFHIPFCKSKCPYCDFYSKKYCRGDEESYTDILLGEMNNYSGSFDTVYFGGGTPSIIEPECIGRLLDGARAHFEIDENSEITIECNPREDLKHSFKKYKSYGINRVSIGMQSAVDKERFALGRSAGRAEVERTVNAAREAGIENISLDLMLGIPNQTESSLDTSFEFIEKMNVKHISAYMLKIEEGTRFSEIRDKLVLPDEDTVSKMYIKTIASLKDIGFEQYEISNFAKPSYESRHNLKYWTLVPYLGIGKTAHSFWEGKRFYYDENMNIIPDSGGGDIDERIMLGLRLNRGIKKELVKKPFDELIKLGLLIEKDDRIALTPEGMLVSNYAINELI